MFPWGLLGTLLDLCVSSLRRGHANLLCTVPILSDDPRRILAGLQLQGLGPRACMVSFSRSLEAGKASRMVATLLHDKLPLNRRTQAHQTHHTARILLKVQRRVVTRVCLPKLVQLVTQAQITQNQRSSEFDYGSGFVKAAFLLLLPSFKLVRSFRSCFSRSLSHSRGSSLAGT